MSDLVIKRTVRVDGTPTDATSVVLRDAAGSYGIRRKDTHAVVVAAGTAMLRSDVGVYTFTVADAAPGVYEYAVEVLLDGQVYRAADEATVGTAVAVAGRYITAADLAAVIPADEYLQLFDRNNDGIADADSMGAAIAAAENQLHGYLAGRYTLPLNTSDTICMGFIRAILVDLAWAAGHPRADMVADDLQNRIDSHTKRLEDIRDGKSPLPLTAQPSTIRWSADERKMTSLP